MTPAPRTARKPRRAELGRLVARFLRSAQSSAYVACLRSARRPFQSRPALFDQLSLVGFLTVQALLKPAPADKRCALNIEGITSRLKRPALLIQVSLEICSMKWKCNQCGKVHRSNPSKCKNCGSTVLTQHHSSGISTRVWAAVLVILIAGAGGLWYLGYI